MTTQEVKPQFFAPNVDFDLPEHRRQVVNKLYQEIRTNRLSQRQLQMLIKLLAGDLENEPACNLISTIVGAIRKETPLSLEDQENIENKVSKLILPSD